jgi:hypothetical protein
VRSDLGARILEELQEFRYENVEGLVDLVGLELIVRVLADLLQRAERALHLHEILRLECLVQSGQELRPRAQATLGHNCGDQDADGGADQLTRVADAREALAFDVLLAPVGKFVEEGLGVVLQDETAQGTSRVICNFFFEIYKNLMCFNSNYAEMK